MLRMSAKKSAVTDLIRMVSLKIVWHGETPMPRTNELIFSIVFKKGMAEKNRLPLNHVISTLREIDSMIREVGRKVQREAGVETPDGDFGIELLAGATGLAFQKGSVKTASAITKDVANGTETLTRMIRTTDVIERKRAPSIDDYGAPVVRGLAAISNIQEKDKTELHIQLAKQGRITDHTKFSEKGIRAIRKMSVAEFAIESLTLYGKLRGLTDRSKTEEEDDIWGELLEDNGNRWRIKFHPSDLGKAQELFTKQVEVFGDATYFKTKFPRMDVKTISEDKHRNYVAAFDRFSQDYEDVFGDRDPEQIIKDIRGVE
jgi:hypothetical protein